MNRKSISIVLVFVTCFLLLTGCSTGNDRDEAAADTTQESAQESVSILPSEAKIGVAYIDDNSKFLDRFVRRLKKYLISAGVVEENIIEKPASPETLESAAKELLGEECSVLIIGNVEEKGAPAITKAAEKAGVPVLYFGQDPGEKERARWEKEQVKASYVGGDDTKAAQLRAEYLDKMDFEKLDQNENREIGTLVLKSATFERANRINEETLEAMDEYHFKVNILDTGTISAETESSEDGEAEAEDEAEMEVEAEDATDEDETDSEEPHEAVWEEDATPKEIEKESTYEFVVQKMNEYGEDLELIICANDMQATGAWKAVSEEKRLVGHDVLILGQGAGPEILEEVARGNIASTFFNDFLGQAECAANYTISYLKGIEVPYTTMIDYVNVTVDNAQEILDVLSPQQDEAAEEENGEEDTEEETQE